jgi:1,3-beta-glucan synthase
MSGYPDGGGAGHQGGYDDGYGNGNGQHDQYYQDDQQSYDHNGYDQGQNGDGYYDES